LSAYERSWASERSLFVNIFANVDFPDDFGPHIRIVVAFWALSFGNFDNTWFHSGAEMMGCKKAFGGPSVDDSNYSQVNIYS
jgi:hypothetical protein